jgi:RNA polymerase sigma factor (sigma-70 family)
MVPPSTTASGNAATADAERRERIDELYAQFGRATRSFFAHRTGDADLAADLNQELYLRVSASLHLFRGECSWRTWIFTIAHAVLVDARRGRLRAVADREVAVDPAVLAQELTLEISADEVAFGILLRRRLLVCLRLLSEQARAVVIGHYFDGSTLRDLTQRLRLGNASGSRAVLLAAQRRLRRCLQGETTR